MCLYTYTDIWFGSVQLCPTLWPHGLQHARCQSPSSCPRACSNSCPLNQWCHPTISSSVIPFSSCPQSFPASGSFQMSQLFISGGQSTGVSASTSVLPMNIQDWSPLGWTGSPCSPRDSQESPPAPQFESITVMLNGFPWKWTEIIRSFLRLHLILHFGLLCYTMRATSFLLRNSWP